MPDDGSIQVAWRGVSATAIHAQEQSTGLQFLDRKQYELIPKAKEPVTGTGYGATKEIIPDSFALENYMPTAQNQGLTSNACAAFAVTSNKAYRVFITSGQKGSPNDCLQSPGFPYSAACQRRAIIQNGQCVVTSFISDELDFLSEIGSLPLAEMPYRLNVCEDWQGRLTEGRNNSSAPYTALPSAPNASLALKMMKNLIAGGNPIIVGFNACKEFRYPVHGYITKIDRSDFPCKGHVVLVVGYDDRIKAVRILNSWGDGTQWKGSHKGKVWMSYDVFSRTVCGGLHRSRAGSSHIVSRIIYCIGSLASSRYAADGNS
jgi:C1A family cysteine protease